MAFSVRDLPRYAVMGIVNVTPDSFSDGGRFFGPDAACTHARELIASGAAVIDIGGESTRPGAEPVAAAIEAERVVPVVEALGTDSGAFISVDTTKAEVARAALGAGAAIVNDVSGARADARMLEIVAGADAGLVLMHMQGEPRTMQHDPRYDDVVGEVGAFLAERVEVAVAAGVRRDAILADPGIGFGKTKQHNVALLAALPRLASIAGVPLVLGTSRKSFLGAVLGGLPTGQREAATLATTVYAFTQGVAMVRVHDVVASARAARLLDVMQRATSDGVAA